MCNDGNCPPGVGRVLSNQHSTTFFIIYLEWWRKIDIIRRYILELILIKSQINQKFNTGHISFLIYLQISPNNTIFARIKLYLTICIAIFEICWKYLENYCYRNSFQGFAYLRRFYRAKCLQLSRLIIIIANRYVYFIFACAFPDQKGLICDLYTYNRDGS